MQPVVNEAFRHFMAHEFAEGKMLLWMDAEAYEKIPFDNVEKLARAIAIYEHYIAEGAPHKINLDEPTLDDLRMKFSEGNRKKLTPHRLTKVFNLVFGKVFQELKFNFLPRFLCSKGAFTCSSTINNVVVTVCLCFAFAAKILPY